MKKFIVFTVAFATIMAMSGLNVLATTTVGSTSVGSTSVETMFTRGDGGGGTGGTGNPIVKAQWVMKANSNGLDHSTQAGTQLLPTGQYQNGRALEVCAVVTDPDGVADINAVYADIFYPNNIYLGPDHVTDRQGCGQIVGNEFSLDRLSKAEGISLFCNSIKNNNNNLPVFNTGYNYAEICAADGELQKETAYVYCGDAALSYEDPSGTYTALVLAQDNYGMDGTLQSNFEYLPLTAFQIDFNAINYGTVKLNTHKIINGDLTWNSPAGTNNASVRNIGNTRLQMGVWQDDMGLGKTDTSWNVRYDARVGNNIAHWSYYSPYTANWLNKTLNLSELEEMDFSIEIFKFPPVGDYGDGIMKLGARQAEHLTCPGGDTGGEDDC